LQADKDLLPLSDFESDQNEDLDKFDAIFTDPREFIPDGYISSVESDASDNLKSNIRRS